ncbi:hypothetical protein U8V72_11555 [Priestia filamentosa]|uniref:hypothetical protein n=1 Tax=Priestia filamentosa TaxID=1402861 RepID=UPI003979BC45
MLKLKKFTNGAEEFSEIGQRVLNLISEELFLFKDVELNFTATLKERYSYDLEMSSEAVPSNLLGIWAYAVKALHLEVYGYSLKKDTDTAFFSVQFRYSHRDGGRNGTSIANFGDSQLNIEYNKKTDELTIINRRDSLQNALRTFLIYFSSFEEINKLISEVRVYVRKENSTTTELKELTALLQNLLQEVNKHTSEETDDEILIYTQELKQIIFDYEYLLKNKKQ